MIKNRASRLPDCYAKTDESNNAKLLSINADAVDLIIDEIKETNDSLDIFKAYGKTLDQYGLSVGQMRGHLNDDQYRYMILKQVSRNIASGNLESVVEALRSMFGLSDDDSRKIILTDSDTSGKVVLKDFPITVLIDAGYSGKEAVDIVKAYLPVGVSIEEANFNGTFEFDSSDDVYNTDRGFADLDGTIGGYLGLYVGDD